MNFYVTLKIKNKWLHRKIFFSWYKRVVNELANNKTFFNNSSYIMQVPCTTFFDNVLAKYHRFNTKSLSLSLSLLSLSSKIYQRLSRLHQTNAKWSFNRTEMYTYDDDILMSQVSSGDTISIVIEIQLFIDEDFVT